MAKTRWKRVGKLSGPANVLGGRWEVVREGSRYRLIDTDGGTSRSLGVFRTMRAAKEWAEVVAAGEA